LIRHIANWFYAFGFDPRKFVPAMMGFPGTVRGYINLLVQNRSRKTRWKIQFVLPCLQDKYLQSGIASGHYFHQDLLVARKIFERKPNVHVDVGSRIDGFVAHVASFRSIEVFDIRDMSNRISNVTYRKCDIMNLPDGYAECCDSLSSLHALEHCGLGRYGDSIDIDGHLKGLEGLTKMLKRNGTLYLSVPIGEERIEFNGHRVFGIATILRLMKGCFRLVSFSYVDDTGVLHENVTLDDAAIAHSLQLWYGCGIFEFEKLG
jgi:hypothetical protein